MGEMSVLQGGEALPHHTAPLAERPPLKYEQLAWWAQREWEARSLGRAYRMVWASESCASFAALKRIKPGGRLKAQSRYQGYRQIPCPYTAPVASFYMPGRKAVLTDSVGAYLFAFERKGEAFEVLYVSAHNIEGWGCHSAVAIALVPPDHLDTWADFEARCNRAGYRLERSEKVYIIGGPEKSFEPNVEWEDVILPEALKADLRADLETFFEYGAALYRGLNLVPFRKLLLVGPPGTGKSTLCAALAKIALALKAIVVYVSTANKGEEPFDKIQRALRITANSQYPVLLVVEELDAYLNPEHKSQILNVLDGFESPNNPRGALLIATTNFPEVIDERIAKRPGRVDRIVYVPEIQDEDQALRMLKRYMGPQWQDEHSTVAPKLVGQTGAFVREVAVYARLLAVHRRETAVALELLRQSVESLSSQLATGHNLMPRRPFGFISSGAAAR